jgi:hypothetical protein
MFVKHIKTLHVSATTVWPSSGGRPSCLVLLLPSLLVCIVKLFIWYVAVCCLHYNVCIRMIPWFYLPRYEESEAYDGKGYGLTYVCVCVPDVLVCRIFGCEVSLIACRSFASSSNGFGSLTSCSVMSRICWWYIWMYVFSQWFIFLLFLHGCISFRVSFAVPYSCLLFSICVAYADARLLVLMYLICSLCLIVTGLPDCTT